MSFCEDCGKNTEKRNVNSLYEPTEEYNKYKIEDAQVASFKLLVHKNQNFYGTFSTSYGSGEFRLLIRRHSRFTYRRLSPDYHKFKLVLWADIYSEKVRGYCDDKILENATLLIRQFIRQTGKNPDSFKYQLEEPHRPTRSVKGRKW